LPIEVAHEGVDIQPDLGPQRLVVWLEYDPSRPAVEGLLDEERRAADGYDVPFRRSRVGTVERRDAPGDAAENRKGAVGVAP